MHHTGKGVIMSATDACFKIYCLSSHRNVSRWLCRGEWLLFSAVHQDASLSVRRKGTQGELGKVCCRASKFVGKTRWEAAELSDLGIR